MEIQTAFVTALQAHQAGDFTQANILYQQILQQQPQHADTLHMMGVLAWQTGHPNEALDLIQQAIQFNSTNPHYYLNLAKVWTTQQQTIQAIQAYQQAIVLKPDFIEAYGNLGQIFIGQQQFSEAETCYRQILTFLPEHAITHNNLGNTLHAQDKLNVAIQAYQHAIHFQSDYPKPYYNLAVIYQKQGKLDEAIAYYQQAIILQPTYVEAYRNLAAILQQQEKLAECEACYQKLTQLIPNDANVLHKLGKVLQAQDKWQAAIQAYKQALQLTPHTVEIYYQLGSVYQTYGDLDQAFDCYQQVLQRDSQFVQVYNNLGILYQKRGQLDKAIQSYQQALALDINYGKAYSNLGAALQEMGDLTGAITYFQKAIDIDPQDAFAHSNYALILLRQANFTQGWSEYHWRDTRQNTIYQLSKVPQLLKNLTGQHFLLHQEQGLGDELLFLRFAPLLKARGASLAYHASDKIAPLAKRHPALDKVLTAKELRQLAELDITHQLLVADLPLALKIGQITQIPSPFKLSVLPEKLETMQQRLKAIGEPPYIGITWWGGFKPQKGQDLAGSVYRHIPLEMLANILRPLSATILVLQRNPEQTEIQQLGQLLNRKIHDFSHCNQDLEIMLALLYLIDEYIGVSNTNMHLRAGLGRITRVLIPYPAEWLYMTKGETSPWFEEFRLYRQTVDQNWTIALTQLQTDLMSMKSNQPN